MKRREVLKNSALFAGAAISAGTFASIVQGCKADTALDWVPSVLSGDQAGLVSSIVERIIPTTDTPGAKEAMVDRFIDKAIGINFTGDEKSMFLDGLKLFGTISKEKFGESFASLSADQKDDVMNAVVADAKGKDKHIWPTLKSLAITGFCTSEIGQTKVLKYDPIPGEWRGCVDLSEVGGTWAY